MNKFRFLLIGKKAGIISLCFAVAVVVASLTAVGWNKTLTAEAQPKKLPICCVQNDEKTVALSFDSAGSNDNTNAILKILDNYKMKTTFFVSGEWADEFPNSVKAISSCGHDVMNNSNSLISMTSLSREKMSDEITACNDKIEKLTGRRPTLFRAPFGEYNNDLLDTASSLNMYCIQWDIDSFDNKNIDTDKIISTVVGNVKPGSIVVFRSDGENTVRALPCIIDKLVSNGYKILPVSKLIYQNNFTINHEGRQLSQLTTTTIPTSTENTK